MDDNTVAIPCPVCDRELVPVRDRNKAGRPAGPWRLPQHTVQPYGRKHCPGGGDMVHYPHGSNDTH